MIRQDSGSGSGPVRGSVQICHSRPEKSRVISRACSCGFYTGVVDHNKLYDFAALHPKFIPKCIRAYAKSKEPKACLNFRIFPLKNPKQTADADLLRLGNYQTEQRIKYKERLRDIPLSFM